MLELEEPMVNVYRERFIKCENNKDEVACNELIMDITYYLLENKWGFVFETVHLAFDTDCEQILVVVSHKNNDEGFEKPIGFYVDKEKGECEGVEDISYDEKIEFIRRTIPLIPELE